MTLGGQPIKPEKVEAGTGFYEQRFARGEIKPELGEITVKKIDEGVAWGSVHWQYLEDMSQGHALRGHAAEAEEDALHQADTTKKGPVLRAGQGPADGRRRAGRAHRAARGPRHGVRPPEGPARQRHRAGERAVAATSTRTAWPTTRAPATRPATSSSTTCPRARTSSSTRTRVQLKGKYQTGIAEIQCMYAPEFNSHSESFELEVK